MTSYENIKIEPQKYFGSFGWLTTNSKINDWNMSSVRPELVEG